MREDRSIIRKKIIEYLIQNQKEKKWFNYTTVANGVGVSRHISKSHMQDLYFEGLLEKRVMHKRKNVWRMKEIEKSE